MLFRFEGFFHVSFPRACLNTHSPAGGQMSNLLLLCEEREVCEVLFTLEKVTVEDLFRYSTKKP
jgi:hypothetical protein